MYAGDGSPRLDRRHDERTDVKSRCAEQERGIGVFLCGTSRFCRSDEAESAVHSLLDQVLRHPSRSFHLTLVTRRAPPAAGHSAGEGRDGRDPRAGPSLYPG